MSKPSRNGAPKTTDNEISSVVDSGVANKNRRTAKRKPGETVLKIEQWPIGQLIEYARNPRQISQSSIDKCSASISEFGFRVPIIVDKRDVIVAGHVRLLAAKKLGLKKVPVHVATDLTSAQIKAFRLAENRTHQEAKDDPELLGLELSELRDEFEFDLDLTGFDETELAEYLGDAITDPMPQDQPANAEGGSGGYPEKKTITLTVEQYELVQSGIETLRKRERDPKISEGRALELIVGSYLAEPEQPIQ